VLYSDNNLDGTLSPKNLMNIWLTLLIAGTYISNGTIFTLTTLDPIKKGPAKMADPFSKILN
jgi:capsular polysaccharide biosynthesis protein